VLGSVFALAVIGTSFPFSTLLSQHRELSAEAAQLHQIQGDNRLLAEQDRQLASGAEVDRLARQEYQLVLPGQTLFDVLPPSGASASTTQGDPADQPLVSPSNAPDMSPDPGLPQSVAPAGRGTGAVRSATGDGTGSTGEGKTPPSSFWSRVAGTLEFWK
jgi:cell division protein FtsB